MDISKLTVQGFKSFYEKSVFTFGKNITAIVGPNGSGKSNITEAIRFVLGEQSAKSMRGKDTTDLLYRGNNVKASKAKVEVEFVRKQRLPQSHLVKERGISENVFVKEMLEKDLVTVTRTVYADGKSEYSMNGVEVRVKDLNEFLLYIHLGNKSSWHISQGEADKVLQANPQERRTIIEDALGLKVYHSRINESQKKLEKTRENIREATLKRREILPELNALGKQVEKIKRSVEFRNDLEDKALLYMSFKISSLKKVVARSDAEDSLPDLELKLLTLENSLAEKEKSLYREGKHDTSFLELELDREEKVWRVVQEENDTFVSKSKNIENNLQYLSVEENRNIEELKKVEQDLQNIGAEGNDIIFSEKSINDLRDKIEINTERIINNNNLDEIYSFAKDTDFSYKKMLSTGSVVNKDNVKQISYLQSIKSRIQEKLQQVAADKSKYVLESNLVKAELEKSVLKLKLVTERVELLKKQILEYKYLASETERELQSLTFERSRIQIKISQKKDFVEKIEEMRREFQAELHEFKVILGMHFEVKDDSGTELTEDELHNLKRNIERLKIRLEESMVTNPDEIMKNFEDMTERDSFLLKEISDLENSMINLEKLISDLKQSLKDEFDLGLEHINKVFDSYVKRLFGGGSAKVFVVEIESRKKTEEVQTETYSSDELLSEVEEAKLGVEIEVEIPKKKVKGLHSLSGGERALISIALNFSIVNQNPAPFMILDETDAALDEANSKRYGEILDMLKQQTKLIVVTHNRETMHFADQVYGVTLSKEGYSKVLSVSFEDAIEYAK